MTLGIFGFLNISLVDALDIIMVALLIYFAFRWIRESSAVNIFLAIILLLVIRIIAGAIGMKMVSSVLGTIIDVGAIAFIVIFQPELRKFLYNIGRRAGDTIENRQGWLQKIIPARQDRHLENRAIGEIAEACRQMSESRTGALIIIRRSQSLEDIMSTGDRIDAEVSHRLILNIFFKNTPLHDGAVVIGDGRILAARCTLPMTDRTDIPASFGMRHKAAIGISEQSDAQVIVVSEETGRISFVSAGNVKTVANINELNLLLGAKEEEKEQ